MADLKDYIKQAERQKNKNNKCKKCQDNLTPAKMKSVNYP